MKAEDGSTRALGVLCLFWLVSLSVACNCLVNHPQTKFCRSEFVMRVKIMERRKIVHTDPSLPARSRYVIGYHAQVLGVYKGAAGVANRTEVWIHTPDAGRLCGVTGMVKDNIYLVSGKFLKDLFYMAYCDLWSEWSKLTEEQRNGVESVYGNNCDCKMRGVNGIIDVPKTDRNLSGMITYVEKSPLWDAATCHYNPVASYYYRTHECETLYTQCVRSDAGGGSTAACRWAPTEEYRLCYEAREEVWRRRNTVVVGMAAALRRRPRCKGSNMRFVKRCIDARRKRRLKRLLGLTVGSQRSRVKPIGKDNERATTPLM